MANARRVLQSVTLYKPEKAYSGFTLFAPMTPVPSNVWLIDMQGRFVHRWQLPGWIRLHADLLPNGNILFGLQDPDNPTSDAPFAGGSVVEMDWDGNVVWKYEDLEMDCHDRVRMRNGNTLIYKNVKIPEDIAAKMKGGTPDSEGDWMIGYALQEITPEGKIVWEWITYEHLDPVLDAVTPLTMRHWWPGWNSVEELPDGNILTCSFNTSNLMIIDKKTGNIKWRWGQDILSFPHNPTMLDNGNILVLDNQRYHAHWWPPDYSRIVEVNPSTNEIEWEYKEENPVDFYTTYIGGCERLPNGNTLICEGAMGRFFEVTPSGEMVWEYVVPFYARRESAIYGLSNCTFRCHRYGPDYPGLQGKELDSERLDLWNRLYGPEAFGMWGGRQIGRGIERAPIEEKGTPQAKYEESKPSAGKPGKEKEVSRRAGMLGY